MSWKLSLRFYSFFVILYWPTILFISSGHIRAQDTLPPLPDDLRATLSWAQAEKVVSSNGETGDLFGQSVEIHGNYAIVGAYNEMINGQEAGTAYIYRRQGADWVEDARLTVDDGATSDQFGYYVSIHDTLAIVGANRSNGGANKSGSAYVFARTPTGWVQRAKLTPSSPRADLQFGHGVAIGYDRAVVGANSAPRPGAPRSRAGAVYVFRREGTSYVQEARLASSDLQNGDRFGFDVALDGDYLIAGADREDGNGSSSGAAYIFARNGTTWTQQAKLLAADGAADDRLGYAVDIDGDYAIAGARHHDQGGTDAGAAYIYRRNGNQWVQEEKLTAADPADNVDFGINVGIHEGRAVVGAFHEGTNGFQAGAVYVFARSNGSWSQEAKVIADDGEERDLFGRSVSIYRNQVIVGANRDDDNGTEAGAAYFLRPTYLLPDTTLTTCGDPVPVRVPIATDAVAGTIRATTIEDTSFTTGGQRIIRWTWNDGNGNTTDARQVVDVNRRVVGLPLRGTAESHDSLTPCWLATGSGWEPIRDKSLAAVDTVAFGLRRPPAAGTPPDTLLGPAVTLDGGTTYTLSFSYRGGDTVTGQRLLNVYLVDANTRQRNRTVLADTGLVTDYRRTTARLTVPSSGAYRIAFESSGRDGGTAALVDEIDLRAAAPPADGAAELITPGDGSCTELVQGGLSGNTWVELRDTLGRLVAAIDPQGNALGDVTATVTDYGGYQLAPYSGRYVLGRHFDLTPTNGPGPYPVNGGVRIRLYHTTAELADYNGGLNTAYGWGDLLVSRYFGSEQDCQIENSTGLSYELIAPVGEGGYGGTAHYVEFMTESFSEFALGAADGAALPVTLTEFTAYTSAAENVIDWWVAREEAFSHYEVERSTDGLRFSAFTEVAGKGLAWYTTRDTEPAAVTYYRLRMVDLDGSFTHSPVISVQRTGDDPSPLAIWPVPANGHLNLRYDLVQDGSVRLHIQDLTGRLLRREIIAGRSGQNVYRLPTTDLPPGQYILRMIATGGERVARFVK